MENSYMVVMRQESIGGAIFLEHFYFKSYSEAVGFASKPRKGVASVWHFLEEWGEGDGEREMGREPKNLKFKIFVNFCRGLDITKVNLAGYRGCFLGLFGQSPEGRSMGLEFSGKELRWVKPDNNKPDFYGVVAGIFGVPMNKLMDALHVPDAAAGLARLEAMLAKMEQGEVV